ncbi:cyclin-like protein [Scheffersomyces xylosifermentans]|uniref:cyclin-like protein n=1 Tax=Scheffersomyces xylosifermentans TaxID=1304137 RepID=UPI00315C744C
MKESTTDTKSSSEGSEENPEAKRKRISNDDLYRRSTQFEIWSYTAESLEAAKKKANAAGQIIATKRFNEAFAELKKASPEVFENNKDKLNPESLLNLITFEEESKYLNYYTPNIIQIAKFFKMPTQVKLTAVSFFKKFYLENSVMQYHPKNIMYTCVFLAAKSENYFVSIESFVKALKGTDAKDILDLEFIILSSLKFTLLVHHPFRPLYGFFLDFQAVLLHPSPLMYDVSVNTLGTLYDKAKNWLNENAVLSDVAFLFTPPQIALAAMYDVDKRVTDRYLKRKFLRDHADKLDDIKEEPENGDVKKEEAKVKIEGDKNIDNDAADSTATKTHGETSDIQTQREQYETLVRTIRKCIKVAKQVSKSPQDEVKEIDRKCFFALNPRKLIEKQVKKIAKEAAPSEVV